MKFRIQMIAVIFVIAGGFIAGGSAALKSGNMYFAPLGGLAGWLLCLLIISYSQDDSTNKGE